MWNPDIFDIKFLFQFIDNPRADIAERSGEVGEYPYLHAHVLLRFSSV